MRITNSMIADNYEKALEENFDKLNESYSQISSGKKFTKISQDPLDALKSLRTIHDLNDTDAVQDNISTAKSWVSNTESTVDVVNNIAKSAISTLTAANNSGTLSDDDKKSYAATLTSLQSELVQELNSTFGSRYVFGGSAEGPSPFKVGTSDDGADEEGKLLVYDYKAGSYTPVSGVTTSTKSSLDLSMPIDVGLGLKMGTDGKVASGSAMETQTSGLSVITFNMTSSGCGDLYDLLGDAASKLQSTGKADLGSDLNSMQQAQDSVLLATTDLGEKSSMLGFLSDKGSTDETNLKSRLSDLADTDVSAATIDFSTRQMAYEAALAVGAKIMEPTLIDFLK